MKTSKQDFECFRSEVGKWIEIFGLKDWDVSVLHRLCDEDDYTAWVTFGSFGTQIANIHLNKKCDSVVTRDEIRRAAFHEVCHVLLYKLCYYVENRFGVQKSLFEQETHSLITTLENVLWETVT